MRRASLSTLFCMRASRWKNSLVVYLSRPSSPTPRYIILSEPLMDSKICTNCALLIFSTFNSDAIALSSKTAFLRRTSLMTLSKSTLLKSSCFSSLADNISSMGTYLITSLAASFNVKLVLSWESLVNIVSGLSVIFWKFSSWISLASYCLRVSTPLFSM